jgi:hypothetical protein
MPQPFDQLLIDPDPARLRRALQEAVRHTGRGDAHGLIAGWLANAQARPEGLDLFRLSTEGRPGERYGGLAWWSDHQGRRHVRTFGGSTGDGWTHRHLARQDDDPRPPLWHIYPERVFRVERPGRASRWLVSCACGATGVPGDLAWMGPCCGPCHDRREEGDPSLVTRPAVLEPLRTVYGVAVSPDGAHVAIGLAGRRLVLRDLEAGSERVLEQEDVEAHSSGRTLEFRTLAFSPDGTLLAAGDSRKRIVRLYPMTEKASKAKLPLHDEYGTIVSALEFSPDGRLLAAALEAGTLGVWSYRQSWCEVYREAHGVTALTFLPDGRTLALGGERGVVRLLDTSSWTERGRIEVRVRGDEDVLFLGAAPDGATLLLLTGSVAAEYFGESQLLRQWDLKRNEETRCRPVPAPSHLVLSPDGRYLARSHCDLQHSPAVIRLWDVQTWQEAGSLEWDTEDAIYALAFAPDGQTLAVGTWLGRVVLFPWRLLLEA